MIRILFVPRPRFDLPLFRYSSAPLEPLRCFHVQPFPTVGHESSGRAVVTRRQFCIWGTRAAISRVKRMVGPTNHKPLRANLASHREDQGDTTPGNCSQWICRHMVGLVDFRGGSFPNPPSKILGHNTFLQIRGTFSDTFFLRGGLTSVEVKAFCLMQGGGLKSSFESHISTIALQVAVV